MVYRKVWHRKKCNLLRDTLLIPLRALSLKPVVDSCMKGRKKE
jgi:hypothetical protein